MPYTTISSHQGAQNWPSEWGTSGTLGIFCTRDFVADDGKSFQQGDGISLTQQFVTTTTITIAANIPTYGSFTLPKTDVATPIDARYIGYIFDSNGIQRDLLFGPFDLVTSLGNSISYLAWVNDNAQARRYVGDTSPSTTQMNLAIAAAINAPATTTQNGIVRLVTPSADSATPYAIETRDPRITNAINVKGYPYLAIGDGVTNDRVAIQAAITAAEAIVASVVVSGIVGFRATFVDVVFPPGVYLIQGTSALSELLRIQKGIRLIGQGAILIFSATGGVNTTDGISVRPSSLSPTYNVVAGFEIRNLSLQVDTSNKPGGYGLRLDTNGSLCQIRHAVIDHVTIGYSNGVIGSGAAEFGSQALLLTNNPANTDGIFHVTIKDSWLYGGYYLYYAGDDISFERTVIASNVVDRANVITMASNFGAQGPYFRGGQIGNGGGVQVRQALGAVFDGVNIEISNPSLTTVATKGAIDLKGDIGLVEGTSIGRCAFVTDGAPIDAIYNDSNTKHTVLLPNNNYIVGAGHYLWNNQGGAASGMTVHQPQDVRSSSPSSATANGAADTEYAFVPSLWQNSNFLQNGSQSISGSYTVSQASPAFNANTTSTTSAAGFNFYEGAYPGTYKAGVQYIGSAHATTARRSDVEIIGAPNGGLAFWTNNGSGNILNAKILPSGIMMQTEGGVLSVSSNTIAPTNQIHRINDAGGLIKTITPPTNFTSGIIYLIAGATPPTADITGNIGRAISTWAAGQMIPFTFSSGTSKWYPAI